MKIDIPERAEVCRWCGCTEYDPCPEGCGWANRQHTLCTACVGFDKAIKALRTKRGRQEMFEIFGAGCDRLDK